jgi:hypothetical protein
VKTGDYDVDVNWNGLNIETITVLETGHYSKPCTEGKGIILHDFLGFRVRTEEGDIFRIKAEKLNSGISVKGPSSWGRDVVTRYVCENLQDCRWEDLLAILKEPSPDYNLMSDNCRSYADATFKQVIRKFLETPSLSPERRSYLASFLNNAPPVMPDEVLGAVRSAAVKAAELEIPLSAIYTIGVVGAAAVAAVVAPTTLATQVASFYISLRCAGIPITPAALQNGLHACTTAQALGPQLLHAVHGMKSLVPVHRAPLILKGVVSTIKATQAVHAPLITRSFLHLVSSKASIITTSIVKCAGGVAPFVWPVALVVAGLFTLFVLYKVSPLVIDGTSPGQFFKKLLRSPFPRRALNQAQGLPRM